MIKRPKWIVRLESLAKLRKAIATGDYTDCTSHAAYPMVGHA
jgi:hypothetical protein